MTNDHKPNWLLCNTKSTTGIMILRIKKQSRPKQDDQNQTLAGTSGRAAFHPPFDTWSSPLSEITTLQTSKALPDETKDRGRSPTHETLLAWHHQRPVHQGHTQQQEARGKARTKYRNERADDANRNEKTQQTSVPCPSSCYHAPNRNARVASTKSMVGVARHENHFQRE